MCQGNRSSGLEGGLSTDSPSGILDTSGNSADPYLHTSTAQSSHREWYNCRVQVSPMRAYKNPHPAVKAERELGYRSRPAGEAIRDAVEWFRENGYLK